MKANADTIIRTLLKTRFEAELRACVIGVICVAPLPLVLNKKQARWNLPVNEKSERTPYLACIS